MTSFYLYTYCLLQMLALITGFLFSLSYVFVTVFFLLFLKALSAKYLILHQNRISILNIYGAPITYDLSFTEQKTSSGESAWVVQERKQL